MELMCPKCRADKVRRVSLIYKGGASSFQATTTGVGIGRGREGFGAGALGAFTSGTNRTLLSQEAAPPKKKQPSTVEFVLLVVGAVMVFANLGSVTDASGPSVWLFVGLAGVAVGARALYRAVKWNQEEFPALLRRWNDSFMCLRCGEVFVPAAPLVREESVNSSNQVQSGTGRSYGPQYRQNEFWSLRPTLLGQKLSVLGVGAIILVFVAMIVVSSLDVSGTSPSNDVSRVASNPRQAPALDSPGRPGSQGDEAKWDAATASDLARQPNANRQWSRLLANRRWEMSQRGQVYGMWLFTDGSGRHESRGEAGSIREAGSVRWYAFSLPSVQRFEFCTVEQPRSDIVACGVAQMESTYMDIGLNAGKWYYTLSWSQGNELAPPYEFVSCCSAGRKGH